MKELCQTAGWSSSSVNRLLNKINNFGTTERKSGGGRPRSVRTATNISTVEDMVCSQDDAPYSHKSPREVACETGVSRSSVVRIVKNDLKLKAFKRLVEQKLDEGEAPAEVPAASCKIPH